jgi:hypothetical protein
MLRFKIPCEGVYKLGHSLVHIFGLFFLIKTFKYVEKSHVRKAKRGIDEMMRDAWRWQSMNPKGYR